MTFQSTESCATGHWSGHFDDADLQQWATQLRSHLKAPQVSLGLVFMAPWLAPHAEQVLEILRVHAQASLLVGCSGASLIAGGEEIEQHPGLAVGLYHIPGANVRAFRFTQADVEAGGGPAYWQSQAGLEPADVHGWLVFMDPFTVDGERWLGQWNEAWQGCPTFGGMASGSSSEQGTQVYLDGTVHDDGAIAVAFCGAVSLVGAVSQGCVPIGEPWTVTKAEGNLIHEIGNRPAYEVLARTFNELPRAEQERAQGNLMLGLVTNEYQEEFRRGDFLIRNLLGGDPSTGVLAVGARPRMGQSVQFQCRDAAAATEDMVQTLRQVRRTLGERPVYGGCLCTCGGRGVRLFGTPHHDAALAQRHFGPLGLAGFFGNGEIGPVGGRNYLHGYTASLALMVGE